MKRYPIPMPSSAPSTHAMEAMLWSAACSIRGAKDAAKFKDYLLPLLFLKRLSDAFGDELKRVAKMHGCAKVSDARALVFADPTLVRFYLPRESRWKVVCDGTSEPDVGRRLNAALSGVAAHNPMLKGVIDTVNFAAESGGERDIPPERLQEIVETFAQPRYRLGLHDVPPDFLGRAYEYLLRKFAEGSGQSAGEFFTPPEVGHLMALILQPSPGESAHDFACGSGGLLVKLHLCARDTYPKHPIPLRLSGQELQSESYAIAQMNSVLHNLSAEIARGDTLRTPKILDADGHLRTFDMVIANPMWNQPFPESVFADARFVNAGGSTGGNGDWAWMQHALACLNETGRAAIVLDAPAASRGSNSQRGAGDRRVRKWFVDHDLLEGVILLPPNIFYNTCVSGSIFVIRRNKSPRVRGKIVLVDARPYARKGPSQDYLPAEDVPNIAQMFLRGATVAGRVAVVTQRAIRDADYNVNPSRWVVPDAPTEVSGPPIAERLRAALATDRRATEAAVLRIEKFAPPSQGTASTLGDVAEHPAYGVSLGASEPQSPDGAHLLRISDLQEGRVDWATVPRCDPSVAVPEDKRLAGGDIVVARVGATAGKTFYVDACPAGATFASYLIRIRVADRRVIPKYLYYVMQSPAYWAHIDKFKGDRLKRGINVPVLQSFPVNIPTTVIQQQVITTLDALTSKVDAARAVLTLLDEAARDIFKSLAQDPACSPISPH